MELWSAASCRTVKVDALSDADRYISAAGGSCAVFRLAAPISGAGRRLPQEGAGS